MNNNSEFTPKVIGAPDAKKEKAIINVYSKICQYANATFLIFEYFMEGEKNLPMFFEFLKAKDPKAFLYRRYIEINNISYPGLSTDKIIELDLLSANMEDIKDLMKHRIDLLAAISEANETRFYFPLEKLFHQIGEVSDFGISFENPDLFKTPEFDKALFEHIRTYTTSEKENHILQVVEKAVEGLNDLIELDIVRNDKQRWENDAIDVISAIEFTLNSERPLSVAPNFSRFKGFRRHFEDRRFFPKQTGNNMLDILSISSMVQIETNKMDDLIKEQSEDLLQNVDAETEQTGDN